MARAYNRLTSRSVAAATTPGRYGDGQGLSLLVAPEGWRRWQLRYYVDRKPKEISLGSVREVTLAEARGKAAEIRRQIRLGIPPSVAKRGMTAPPTAETTFGDVAESYIEAQTPSWRSKKHAAQWRATLTTHASKLWPMPVDMIGVEHVLAVLQPIWTTKPETASRLRGRIETILTAAAVRGLRDDRNPAAWKGRLQHLLPKPPAMTRGHHRALPFKQVPGVMAHLQAVGGASAMALEFAILTAARSGEVLGAQWSEIDLAARVWTVPAARMKGGREHRVPLSDRAIAILLAAKAARTPEHPYVFPGMKWRKPLSSMALEMVLRRLEVDATPHGFRSTFRDWAGEVTSFPREVAEAALAHVVGDATERAYRRGDALEKRRALMEAWANHCEPRIDAI
jgi:integrase